MAVHNSTWEQEAPKDPDGAQGHSQLHNEFKATLGFTRPYLKTKQRFHKN